MGTINLVLYAPEIPHNTGNIMRTCLATNCILHLIEPLGFSLDEKAIKRSGANYDFVSDFKYFRYKDLSDFFEKNKDGEFYYLTRYGEHDLFSVNTVDENKNYYFILGSESSGLPYDLLKENINRTIRLPMTDKVRSLNLSNCAAIIIYEALRQQGFKGLEKHEPSIYKGSDFLKK